jgi:hypothetical protein
MRQSLELHYDSGIFLNIIIYGSWNPELSTIVIRFYNFLVYAFPWKIKRSCISSTLSFVVIGQQKHVTLVIKQTHPVVSDTFSTFS